MGRPFVRDFFPIVGNPDEAGLHGGVLGAEAVEDGVAGHHFGLETGKEVFQIGEFGFNLGKACVRLIFHGVSISVMEG
jgi:hypothetical protein